MERSSDTRSGRGEFKWFIYRLSRNHDESFKELGTFGERQLARMADMKLLTEVMHACLFGIKTTNKRDLDHIYQEFDDSFEGGEDYEQWIDEALLTLIDLEEIHKTGVTKSLSLYSLLLALLHSNHDVKSLRVLGAGGIGVLDREDLARNLSELAEVLELDESEVPKKFEAFAKASDKGTNVKMAREIRFEYYYKAVANPS